MLSKIIPNAIKVSIRQFQREMRDRKSGVKSKFAASSNPNLQKSFIEINSIAQPIHYNPLSANKVENIKIAIDKIQPIIIYPNEIFSFWESVKKPTKKDGYKTGRNIIGDSLQEDIGGGLCQVAGIIYHLALLSGMEIIERHNHTIDLYKENERYTPIGTDATVVFGYKDIRFMNKSGSPISFQFNVNQTQFSGSVLAAKEIPIFNLHFFREEFDTYRTVKTYRTKANQELFLKKSQTNKQLETMVEVDKEYINLSRYNL